MKIMGKQKDYHLTIELTSATPHEYKTKGKNIIIDYGFAHTPFGECFVGSSENGICMFQFCLGNKNILIDELKDEWINADFRENLSIAKDVVEILFLDKSNSLPIKLWLKGTPFQFQVWKTLIKDIPFGTIISYKELAQLAGYPNAIRAVASAVARNPVGYIIPCHRVVRNSGSLGQYHWGVERKKAILEWEK